MTLKLSEPCIVIHKRKKINKMHLYLIILFQLNYPLYVSNTQVHRQEAVSVHAAYSISVHAAYSISVHAAYSIFHAGIILK
jgi:hypothetical protein